MQLECNYLCNCILDIFRVSKSIIPMSIFNYALRLAHAFDNKFLLKSKIKMTNGLF